MRKARHPTSRCKRCNSIGVHSHVLHTQVISLENINMRYIPFPLQYETIGQFLRTQGDTCLSVLADTMTSWQKIDSFEHLWTTGKTIDNQGYCIPQNVSTARTPRMMRIQPNDLAGEICMLLALTVTSHASPNTRASFSSQQSHVLSLQSGETQND